MLAKQTGLSRSQVCHLSSFIPTFFNSIILKPLMLSVKLVIPYSHQIGSCVQFNFKNTLVNQVSNWFINARVRLWKPMVEEIHMLETRQAQKAFLKEDRNANKSSDHLSSANSLISENPSTSTQRVQDIPSKRTRSELPHMPVVSEPFNLSYNSLSSHPHVGVGISMAGGSGGVSLTLGLHQNNGIGLSEPFPINAAQRFGLGLEVSSEGYVIGGFEAQNRHFGRDVIGGQLLHDFVG